MNKDKQIDVIYEDLVEIFDEEYNRRNLITPQNTAERMTDKGYRKSTDVAEEIFADLDKALGELAMKYSDEGFHEHFGVCEEIFTKVIYPIKKKYTEVTERRKGVENSPVDYSTPNVTDQKGEGE